MEIMYQVAGLILSIFYTGQTLHFHRIFTSHCLASNTRLDDSELRETQLHERPRSCCNRHYVLRFEVTPGYRG
jgi:hypothetical protein